MDDNFVFCFVLCACTPTLGITQEDWESPGVERVK
jgi:hypothetical protein